MSKRKKFTLVSKYKPAGDQPSAIKELVNGLGSPATKSRTRQTLLGVTGSGKTFTIANVIEKVQRPTLVIAHNKTLAAQLASEFKDFFPHNAVHYFVSYYDYYQPEAYMPITDTYIEKEAIINEEIDRLRHAATQSLLTRDDVIIVASVSAIYGIGNPSTYAHATLGIKRGEKGARGELVRSLVHIYFTRTSADLVSGTFRALGTTVEIHPAHQESVYRIIFSGATIARIEILDPITREIKEEVEEVTIFPARHFVTPGDEVERALRDIEAELKEQLKAFEKAGKNLEAERLSRRVRQDIAMIREVGYCNGIENYSRHFDGRIPGEPPHSLLSYFAKGVDAGPAGYNFAEGGATLVGGRSEVRAPHSAQDSPRDFLTIIDESHVTIPQIRAMYAADRARKDRLVEYGFRLPSARDNRPLTFDEFDAQVQDMIFVSATPAEYEREVSWQIVEQIVRPTGLLDPEITVRPVVEASITYGDVSDTSFTPPTNQGSDPLHKTVSDTSPVHYPGQVKDVIHEIEQVTQRGARTLVTVLTKKIAEDLTDFLKEKNIRAEYIHSDVKTFERIDIMTRFRKGEFDVLVGVNLLREGLDLPEVELVAILDADKEGFLRSETSLVQTMGRAARNVSGRVILYADTITGSMERAIGETNRRREKQQEYNKKHNITPKTVQSAIKESMLHKKSAHAKAVHELTTLDTKRIKNKKELKALIAQRRKAMLKASKELDFETAALLRDEIKALEERL